MTQSIPWESNQYNYSGIVGDGEYSQVDKAIILVHGNSRDAYDWIHHFNYFSKKGEDESELWAISFDDSNFTHSYLAQQLEEFIANVLEKTGLEEVSIISHSLGVTVTRYWMYKFNRYDQVNTFIGLAGANHGSSLCPPKSVALFFPESSKYKPCECLTDKSLTPTFVEQLNAEEGETSGNVKYYTIRGSRDKFFLNCPDSPILEGAEENLLLDTGHEGVRESPESLEYQYNWITENYTF